MQTQTLTPENYILRLGKYKNMRAADIAEIYEVDKNGEDQPKGLQYLQWLIEQDWFRHKDIIEQVIKNAIDCFSGDYDKEPEQPKKSGSKTKEGKETKERKKCNRYTYNHSY